MRLSEFSIGSYFFNNGIKYMCTDIGSRVVVAIRVYDNVNLEGPPYSAMEIVLDETEINTCTITKQSRSFNNLPNYFLQ